jgi:flagellar biogenesis protein FliO
MNELFFTFGTLFFITTMVLQIAMAYLYYQMFRGFFRTEKEL